MHDVSDKGHFINRAERGKLLVVVHMLITDRVCPPLARNHNDSLNRFHKKDNVDMAVSLC